MLMTEKTKKPINIIYIIAYRFSIKILSFVEFCRFLNYQIASFGIRKFEL